MAQIERLIRTRHGPRRGAQPRRISQGGLVNVQPAVDEDAPTTTLKALNAERVELRRTIVAPGDDWVYAAPESEPIPLDSEDGAIIGEILAFLTGAGVAISTGVVIWDSVEPWMEDYKDFLAFGLLATRAVLNGTFVKRDPWIVPLLSEL